MATIPIEVIVQDAEAPIVPSEDGTNNTETNIAVPDTGTISSSGDTSSSATSIILPAILLVLAIGSIVAILIHKYHKQKKDKISKKEKLAVAASSTIAVLAIAVLIGNLVIPATKAATSDIEDGITPAEDKVSIVVTRDGGAAEASIESKATITSTSDFGYKVLLSMAEGVETSNLYLDGDTTSQYYIASVEAENEEGAELTDNTWGFALEEGANYTAVSLVDNAATVAEGDEAVEDENLSIYYGVKVSSDLPAGTYSGGEIEYNLISLEPTISTLTYMQDFAELSEDGKASVLRSMTQGEQYTLKDGRDEKEYFISKLADDNAWMTQNLDFDIISGKTYTPADTDIHIDWTPLSGTATTSVWGSGSGPEPVGLTKPYSYDPGNLYWNGELNENWDGTLENMAIADPLTVSGTHYHIGNYYNWTAAIAMDDSSDYTQGQTDIDQSICPAGWRLPTYSGDKSYQNLINLQNLTSGAGGNIQESPVYFAYGGKWYGYSTEVGSSGYYLSDTYRDRSTIDTLFIFASGNLFPHGGADRAGGSSIRCVAR